MVENSLRRCSFLFFFEGVIALGNQKIVNVWIFADEKRCQI